MFDGKHRCECAIVVEYYCISSSERETKESHDRFCKEINARSHNANFSILDGRSKLLPSYSFCGFFTAVCWHMFSTRGTSFNPMAICQQPRTTCLQIMAMCNQFMAICNRFMPIHKPSMAICKQYMHTMTGICIYLTEW